MENKNWGLQKQELSPLKISEKEKFEIARAAKKIGEAGEEEIRQALRYAMVKIGLRGANFPTGIEKFLLIRHVHENFFDNTVDEIRVAFDWAISGRIDEDYNCYENFSCAYFSRIMNAYNRLADAAKTKDEKKFIKKEDQRKEYDWKEFVNGPFVEKLKKLGINPPE